MSFSTLTPPTSACPVGVGFTDRLGGRSAPPYNWFNLGRWGEDEREASVANIRLLGQLVECDQLAFCAQVHGTTVLPVDDDYPVARRGDGGAVVDARLPEGDALVTRRRGIGLVIRVADCVPVLLADPDKAVIAAAHAGRVGLLAGVLDTTVAAMRALGAEDIQAWVGPHICAGCYEVPHDMAAEAWAVNPATRATSDRGTPAIDLGAGARLALENVGVTVTRQDPCTSCDDRFFSHRRDAGRTGRQCGVIWMRR